MTKQEIIDKYFKKPNWLGNRYCIYSKDYRINRKGILQYKILWSIHGIGEHYWTKITWQKFHNYLFEMFHEKNKIKKANNINNFDWRFEDV